MRHVACALVALSVAATGRASATDVVVTNKTIGTTIKYQGAQTSETYQSLYDDYIEEMGLNIVRASEHSMGQTTPFDGHTIAEVKANPDVLDWNAVDAYFAFDKPWLTWAKANGKIFVHSIYWNRNWGTYADCPGNASPNGAYYFRTGNPADENAYYVAIFAWAYWANVKNDLNLTHLECSNEPDTCGGNGRAVVDKAGQMRLMEITKEALAYVNQSVVAPPKTAFVLGPGAINEWNGYVQAALASPTTSALIDAVSFHAYWDKNLFAQARDGALDIKNLSGGKKKSWLTEWGQWWYADGYSNKGVVQDMAPAIANMGLWGMEMNQVWQLADWHGNANWPGALVSGTTKTRLFYVLKMLDRALLSEKEILETSLPNAGVAQGANGVGADKTFAWATRDASNLYVIFMNHQDAIDPSTFDLTALPEAAAKQATVYKVVGGAGPYSEQVEGTITLDGGRFSLNASADTHYVVVIRGAGSASDGGASSTTDGGGTTGVDGSADGGGTASGAGGTRMDGGADGRSGAAGSSGAGIAAGGGSDSPSAAGLEPQASPGCGCQLGSRAPGAAWLFALLGLAMSRACARQRSCVTCLAHGPRRKKPEAKAVSRGRRARASARRVGRAG
jgi:hypothetical protein